MGGWGVCLVLDMKEKYEFCRFCISDKKKNDSMAIYTDGSVMHDSIDAMKTREFYTYFPYEREKKKKKKNNNNA